MGQGDCEGDEGRDILLIPCYRWEEVEESHVLEGGMVEGDSLEEAVLEMHLHEM